MNTFPVLGPKSADSDIDFVRRLVLERTAIALDDSKGYLVETRLAPLAQSEGDGSLSSLVRRLRGPRDPRLERLVIESLTTHETLFFRDIHPFEALRTMILPPLIARGEVRIWCAACSSGQEPYSIAMLVRELAPDLADGQVSILATDVSRAILQRARDGVFCPLEVGRGLPASRLLKHFVRDGQSWRVKPEVRRMVEFRELNLAESWPSIGRFDVVFLRNVLIYFEIDTRRQVLRRVRGVLKPDAPVFLGTSESPMNIDDELVPHTIGSAVCYREASPGGRGTQLGAATTPPDTTGTR